MVPSTWIVDPWEPTSHPPCVAHCQPATPRTHVGLPSGVSTRYFAEGESLCGMSEAESTVIADPNEDMQKLNALADQMSYGWPWATM